MKRNYFYFYLILLFCFCFSASASASDVMEENFDSYNIGTIHEQGEWGSSSGALVNNEQYVSASQSVKLPVGSYGANWVAPSTTNIEKFLYFSFYIDDASGDNNTVEASFKPTVHEIGGGNVINSMLHICGTGGATYNLVTDGDITCSTPDLVIDTGLVLDTWYDVVVEVNFVTGSARAKVDDDDFSEWYNNVADQGIDYNVSVNINNLNSADSKIYFDNIIWGEGSEESGYIEIIDPINDETVLGSAFDVEFIYWNYDDITAPFDKAFIYIWKENIGTLYYNFFSIDTDNVEEEKTRSIPTVPEDYISILGSYNDVIMSVILYNSTTGIYSDSVQRTFNISTPGSRYYDFSYMVYLVTDMTMQDGRPSKIFNNTDEQEIIVSADIGDISCDDISIDYFDFNSYTDNTFTVIDQAETINEIRKGCVESGFEGPSDEKVYLYLSVTADVATSVYYQFDYYDDEIQDNKLNFLRFVIDYDIDDGVSGGVVSQDILQDHYCEDMTFYIPKLFSDEPFKIIVLNKICKALFAPPSYFPNQMDRIKLVLEQKFSFLFQIQTKMVASASVIASGSTSPPSVVSGSYNGMTFNIADMFGGMSSSIVWCRSLLAVLIWLAFIIWLLRDAKKLFSKDAEVINNN